FPQLPSQPCHLLDKRLAVVFLLLCANITPRCQNKVVLFDLVQAGGFTEAGDVFVGRSRRPAFRGTSTSLCVAFAFLPGMEGVSDFGDVVVGEVPQYPVAHVPQAAGIYEQELFPAVAL